MVPREGKPPLVASFGAIPLRRKETVVQRTDSRETPPVWKQTDVIKRLLVTHCELCGTTSELEVHHIHKMADLHKPGRREKPAWMKHMIGLKRKTRVVCTPFHRDIHAGRPLKHEVKLECRVP